MTSNKTAYQPIQQFCVLINKPQNCSLGIRGKIESEKKSPVRYIILGRPFFLNKWIVFF